MGFCAAASVSLFLAASANPSAARPDAGEDSLRQGLALFQAFQDEKAAPLISSAIQLGLVPARETVAHLYLGLIAFNHLDSNLARREFRLALKLNAFLELPLDWSPKAKLFLRQVRDEALAHHEIAQVPPPQASPQVLPAAPLVMAPAPEPRSHLASYLVAGVGVLALGAGIVGGQLQASAQSSLTTTTFTSASQLTGARQTVANDGIAADVLFGTAAVAVIVAAVLFFTVGSPEDHGATAGVTMRPSGLALGGTF